MMMMMMITFAVYFILVSFRSWCTASWWRRSEAERCSNDMRLHLCISNVYLLVPWMISVTQSKCTG